MGTIGILLDAKVFRGIQRRKTGHERLHLYNRAAARHGVKLIYLNLNHIRPSSTKTVGYKWGKGKYIRGTYPIPRVIHNRAMAFSESSRKRLRWLSKTRFLFNGKTRYSKYHIYRVLRSRYANHLPETVRYSRENLRRMMSKHSGLFIKPQSGSVGEGIIQLIKLESGSWRLRRRGKGTVMSPQKVRNLIHRSVKNRGYLVQQAIPLAKYHGNPYDIRVTVQRGANGDWQVVGMFGKVARKGSGITNVARGGKVRKTEELFRHNFVHPAFVASNVRQVSLSMSRYLGTKLNRLADVGLDIGVDNTGKPYLIEMNARDQRYGFRKAGMNKAFYKTYENPVLYGKYILRSRQP